MSSGQIVLNTKDLLTIDARIAKLRDQIAGGNAPANVQREIDQLVNDRMTLIRAKVDERSEIRP